LPADLDYRAMGGLSNEAKDKLSTVRPATLGQAARIEGMTPGAITAVLANLKRAAKKADEAAQGWSTRSRFAQTAAARPAQHERYVGGGAKSSSWSSDRREAPVEGRARARGRCCLGVNDDLADAR